MNEEYEDYRDFKEDKKTFLSNFSRTTWIVLLIILFGMYYLLRTGNASIRDFLIPILIFVGVLIAISRGESVKKIEYITIQTAQQILLNGLKNYNDLRKEGICKIALPRGEVQLGNFAAEANPLNPEAQLTWQIGFCVFDEDDGGTPKYYLSKVDPKMGGRGLLEIQKCKQEYNGIPLPWFEKIVYLSGEKFAELKARGTI